jgi:sulfur carrier protein ThiS adenylyltransferase
MNDRFEPQRDLVPQDRLRGLTATVVGVGAVGRQVAIQLAGIGVQRLQLVDFDRVEAHNVTTQGYLREDIGRLKVAAVQKTITAIDPTIDLELIADRFRLKQVVGPAIFCCVDSISSRTSIWRSVQHRFQFWADGRMLGEVIRVLAAVEQHDRQHYASTLFMQSEAEFGHCTSRSTIYAAGIAAGMMVHQFCRWLRRMPLDTDASLNLLAGELVQAPSSLLDPVTI